MDTERVDLLISKPHPGQIVQVRQRLHVVEAVAQRKLASDATPVRLACIEDDAQGTISEVLWERELDAHIRTDEYWKRIAARGFDPVRRFAGYLHALRWNCVTSTNPKLLQSPFRAGIKIEPYQLEPLRKALRLPRVNLFIADDVGLGKTIEAGLIARELLLRKRVRDIVVSCPPSMLIQWQEELATRFGLRFEILDKEYLQRVRRERGFSINPWTTNSRFLISHRLLIDEAYISSLRDWLGDLRPGSLFILDEAHHAAPASQQRYAVDSQLTRSVRDLAQRFEHRLFLSATPHNGHSNSFSALLEILDPQRFVRGVRVTARNRDDVMIRRIKEDLRAIQGGFPQRIVQQITLLESHTQAPELRLAALLADYQAVWEDRVADESKRVQATFGLLIGGLQQRLFSSVEAFARTLRVHRKTIERQRSSQIPLKGRTHLNLDLLKPLDPDDDRAALSSDDLAAEEELQFDVIAQALPQLNVGAEADRLLDEMSALAENCRNLPDARVQAIGAWIDQHMHSASHWNDTRIIIFTEYEDTLRYLQRVLRAHISASESADDRILTFKGSTSSADRESIKAAFNADPKHHPVRILIATDAAREGLNLQAHCSHLFHFDIPWNPSRMEQRNGRIDRKLQPAKEVYCYYFVYRNRPEDRILETIVRKTDNIRRELGSLSRVIDEELGSMLKHGIRRSDIALVQEQVEAAGIDHEKSAAIMEDLEASRERQDDLRRSIDTLRNLLADSKKAVGLEEDQFRATISTALEMLGAPALKDLGNGRFAFPNIDATQTAWADTMDSLRTPKPRDQRLFEWRATSHIRPVVFEDPGRVTDEVVQLHLEQRVVQRLLSRFLSQGFVHHDLSRACLAQTQDAIPRVLLLGRLALYGPGAARLHEELVTITARWSDPAIRTSHLVPYARETELKTLDLLDQALLTRGTANETIQNMLLASAATDVAELLPHLTQRAEQYAVEAQEKLSQRGVHESAQMRELLETQRKHIGVRQEQDTQIALNFSEDELRQLNADRRHWTARLAKLQLELESEPQRIRDLYQVQAQRIEPVGLVYLWPAAEGNASQ